MGVSVISNRSLRSRILVRGAVQGVGFRPFVYRLATELTLNGWVQNSAQGVFIEIEGDKETIGIFLFRLKSELPPLAWISALEETVLPAQGYNGFEIRKSSTEGTASTVILPDIAVCPDCIRELFDPADRRYLYPFINCTNCGPRFTIIEAMPYDRPNTTMKYFAMCNTCREEYENPLNRRFHAQPIACPECGPRVELWDSSGNIVTDRYDAITQAAERIRTGAIVALKGLGGFHLIADARNGDATAALRARKHREEKPFALMFPSLSLLRRECEVSLLEERLLTSPESPIVLLKKRAGCLSDAVAPRNSRYGAMLPYTPLHHLLMKELGFPVVATSGNISDEPMCIDEYEALRRLAGIADCFLVHNRKIQRHADDSIVREMAGREMALRRARGYAPLPIPVGISIEQPVLAVGAHLKNTVAIANDEQIIISQHIGDLETKEAYDAFTNSIRDLKSLYKVNPERIVCDLHPDYLSTCFADNASGHNSVERVQHHYAHIASCMAEHQITGRTLGVAWDGTGYGDDGTIWGGEFLLTNDDSFARVASFRTFPLPGGDRAITQPRRSALGVLFELFGNDTNRIPGYYLQQEFSREEFDVLQRVLANASHSPRTSSVGRLFDAVASLVGVRQKSRYEGQAAMELEFLTERAKTDEAYSIAVSGADKQEALITLDWEPAILALLDDIAKGVTQETIAAKFHNALSESIVAVAQKVGERRIALSGGCFQNAYLLERTVKRLQEAGFLPYWHRLVPPNDGGIALGQLYATLLKHDARTSDVEKHKKYSMNKETVCA